MTVTVEINGETRELAEHTDLAAVVATVTQANRGVAVALNDEVVPRGAWPATLLAKGDRVEILTAVQGG